VPPLSSSKYEPWRGLDGPSAEAGRDVSARMATLPRSTLRRLATTLTGVALVCFGLPVAGEAQEPTGPPPPSSTKTSAGPGAYELLPELGKIGAQVGVLGAWTSNPYEVGAGYEVGGYVDLPLVGAPGGKLSYEMLVTLSHGRSDPFMITDPIAYVAN